MVDFKAFDARGYRTLDVRTGYGEWSPTYDQTVEDAMDVDLLDALYSMPWPVFARAVDLGCGTGRIGAWLHDKGVKSIDGVDLTPEMLAVARSRQVYDRLLEADLAASGLASEDYDLVMTCLVDDHLTDLQPLYSEAWRLADRGGSYVLVGYHPHFIMATGTPTHFDNASGEPVAIETHVHLLSEHITSGLTAGWTLVEMKERIIDDSWLALKPKWKTHRDQPIAFALGWRKQNPDP
jgi:SAM-dependent methyltransferase